MLQTKYMDIALSVISRNIPYSVTEAILLEILSGKESQENTVPESSLFLRSQTRRRLLDL